MSSSFELSALDSVAPDSLLGIMGLGFTVDDPTDYTQIGPDDFQQKFSTQARPTRLDAETKTAKSREGGVTESRALLKEGNQDKCTCQVCDDWYL